MRFFFSFLLVFWSNRFTNVCVSHFLQVLTHLFFEGVEKAKWQFYSLTHNFFWFCFFNLLFSYVCCCVCVFWSYILIIYFNCIAYLVRMNFNINLYQYIYICFYDVFNNVMCWIMFDWIVWNQCECKLMPIVWILVSLYELFDWLLLHFLLVVVFCVFVLVTCFDFTLFINMIVWSKLDGTYISNGYI